MNKDLNNVIIDIERALKKEDFTPAEIISKYTLQTIANAITEIVSEVREKKDNKIEKVFNELELQNLYLLARVIITKNIFDKREKKLEGNERKKDNKIDNLIPKNILHMMYKIQSVY